MNRAYARRVRCRVHTFVVAAAVSVATITCRHGAAAEPTFAPFRLATSAGAGLTFAKPDPPIPRDQNQYDPTPFSAGFGGDVRAGVQLLRWLAVDAQVFAETALLAADARAGLLLELAPVRAFALGGGIGVGGLWTANFVHPSPKANFTYGSVRAEVRSPLAGSATDDLCFGLEGVLGATHQGTVPEGSRILGARLFVGFVFR